MDLNELKEHLMAPSPYIPRLLNWHTYVFVVTGALIVASSIF